MPVVALNHTTVQSMASGSSGLPLSDTVIEDTGGYIIDKYNTTANPEERRTRASVADELLDVTPVTYSDAVREELIGKTVNLTKIGGKVDAFTIVVLAQTIKDVGGDGVDIDIWKTPADGSDAKKVTCQLGRFDVNADADTEWRDDAYGDEITAEQKIIVKGYRASNGDIEITSFQYIE